MDYIRTEVRHCESEVLFYRKLVRLTNRLLAGYVTHATHKPVESQAVLLRESGRM